jgi:hypothetical protein
MGKYRVKPEIVDAEIYEEGMEDIFYYEIPNYGMFTEEEASSLGFMVEENFKKIPVLHIKATDATVIINPGDYIVTDSQGNKFPLSPEEFNRIYEKVEEEDKTYSILFHNCLTDQYQVYRVRAKNIFRAGRAFYRKHDRKIYRDCIEHINEI